MRLGSFKKFPAIYFFLIIIVFLLGVFNGIYFLSNIPKLKIKKDSRYFSLLGLKKPVVLGFYPYWTFNKEKGYSNFLNEYCYFSLTLNPDGTIQKLQSAYEQEPGWTLLQTDNLKDHLQALKEKGNKLSLLVHLSNQEDIETLLENPKKNAQNLINEVIPIIKEYRFDDLNLDIEYFQKVEPEFQNNFTQFVRQIKSQLNTNTSATLTIDIIPMSLVEQRMTNIKDIQPLADYIVLMAYDYHYIYSYLAGPVAPAGGAGIEREYDIEKTLQVFLNYAPREKIYLGIPLYGYSFETISNQPNAPAIPGGTSILTSANIEKTLEECDECQIQYGRYSKEPYIIYQPEGKNYYKVVYFEDALSLQKKLSLAQKYHLHGVALWAIGYEDNKILEPLKDFKKLIYFHPSI
jgi:spore germination protein YaaH